MATDFQGELDEFLVEYRKIKKYPHIYKSTMADLYFKMTIWLEKIKDSSDENNILMYCRCLTVFNELHTMVMPYVKDHTNKISDLLSEDNSFGFNLISQTTTGRFKYLYLDVAVKKNKTNTFIYYNKWAGTSDMSYLLKSAQTKCCDAMLKLIAIYMIESSRDLDLAVYWYNQIQKYYVQNHTIVDFQKSIGKEMLDLLEKHMAEKENPFNEIAIVHNEIISLSSAV